MIAFARASHSAISTSYLASGTQPHFLIKSMSSSTKGEIAATSLGNDRSSSMPGSLVEWARVMRNLPLETCSFSSVGRQRSSEHGPLAFRLPFGGLILNHIPMLHEYPVFDAQNIRGNPIRRGAETAKTPVHDHEVSLSHDSSRFIP